VEAAAREDEAVDDAALSRLALYGFGLRAQAALVVNGQIYVGSLVDDSEMEAFYSTRASSFPKVDLGKPGKLGLIPQSPADEMGIGASGRSRR